MLVMDNVEKERQYQLESELCLGIAIQAQRQRIDEIHMEMGVAFYDRKLSRLKNLKKFASNRSFDN